MGGFRVSSSNLALDGIFNPLPNPILFIEIPKLVPKLPSIDYSWIRRCLLKLNYGVLKDLGAVVIAVDAGRFYKSSGWI